MPAPPHKTPAWFPNVILAAALLLILRIANVKVWTAFFAGHDLLGYLWQMFKSM